MNILPSASYPDTDLPALEPNEDNDNDQDDESQSLLKLTAQTISDNPLPPSLPTSGKSTPLLLSDAQKRMILNFDKHLPQAERLIAWFPGAYNSHATVIVR